MNCSPINENHCFYIKPSDGTTISDNLRSGSRSYVIPICVRTEKVLPKLSSIQDIRGNLVDIVSLLKKSRIQLFHIAEKSGEYCFEVTTFNSLTYKIFWSRQFKITTMCNFCKKKLKFTYNIHTF